MKRVRSTAKLSVTSTPPGVGVPGAVEHCIDHDVDSSNLVKHRVGKAPKESSSHRGVDQLIRLGTAADRRDARPDSGEKIGCEPGALRLVPAVSFVKIKLSLRREPKPLHFRRLSLVRTSAQDFAADGFRACARRRRASSLRCASVTGIASGVSARLSQISSSRRRRSATLSERISVRTVLMAAFSASRSGAASLISVRITRIRLRDRLVGVSRRCCGRLQPSAAPKRCWSSRVVLFFHGVPRNMRGDPRSR